MENILSKWLLKYYYYLDIVSYYYSLLGTLQFIHYKVRCKHVTIVISVNKYVYRFDIVPVMKNPFSWWIWKTYCVTLGSSASKSSTSSLAASVTVLVWLVKTAPLTLSLSLRRVLLGVPSNMIDQINIKNSINVIRKKRNTMNHHYRTVWEQFYAIAKNAKGVKWGFVHRTCKDDSRIWIPLQSQKIPQGAITALSI